MDKTISQFISDKEKINSLTEKILFYQKNLEPSLLKEILDHISPYIWAYPKLSFCNLNEDVASDFYLYIHERFENVLLKYRVTLGKFSTYLSIRLQTYFLNFIGDRNKDPKNISHLPLLEEQLILSTENQEEVHVQTQVFLNQLRIYKLKDNKRYLILKLYYFDWFDEDDFILCTKIFSLTYSELLNQLDVLRNHIWKKKQQKFQYETQLNQLYTKNVNHHSFVKNHSDVQNSPKQWKKIQQNLLDKYLATNCYPAAKVIAEITGCTEYVVSNIINGYKKIIKKQLIDPPHSSDQTTFKGESSK